MAADGPVLRCEGPVRRFGDRVLAVAFALALLGGNFLGPGAAPELLARLALLTPNGWALRGFTDVAVDAATTGELVRTLAVLTATGVGFGGVGVARMHRVVRA